MPEPILHELVNYVKLYGALAASRHYQMGEALIRAVDDISLEIRSGEVFGLLGPNGAGKTTTMNVLLGFVNATSGDAKIFGLTAREPQARQRLGYLPELTYYYKFLSAEELLRFYAEIFGDAVYALEG